MKKKRQNFIICLSLAFLGIVLLSIDRFTVSADANTSFGQSFTVITIVALFLLLVAAIWFYKMSFE